jgi:hypothetical protein
VCVCVCARACVRVRVRHTNRGSINCGVHVPNVLQMPQCVGLTDSTTVNSHSSVEFFALANKHPSLTSRDYLLHRLRTVPCRQARRFSTRRKPGTDLLPDEAPIVLRRTSSKSACSSATDFPCQLHSMKHSLL